MLPYLFMASIGSCVGVLVTHFCQQHDLDATGLTVVVNYDKVERPTRFTNICVSINLPNADCGDECIQKAIKHVAEHCPVHETMATLEDVKFLINAG